jgi:hypothetical protein
MPGPVETRLGPIEQVHRVRRNIRRNRLIVSVALLAAASLAWVAAAGRGYLALTRYGPLLVGRWTTAPVVAAFVLTLLGAWFGFHAWRAARYRVRLHEGGVAVLRGRRGQGLSWDRIRALWSRAVRTGLPGLPGRLHLRLDLESTDGRRLRLDDSLEDFAALAQSVKSHVYPALLEGFTRDFNAGQVLAFGPLQVSRSGLTDGRRKSHSWDTIKGIEVAGGRLIIRTDREGKPVEASYPADRIPNVELCAQLLQEIGQPQ